MGVRRLMFLAACLALLAACSDREAQSTGIHEAEFFVFGTQVQVTLAAVDTETARRAFTRLQGRMQSWHRDWHAWEPGELSQLNDVLAAGGEAAATGELLELVRLSQMAEAATGGRFNAGIGRLVALWGFHTSDYPITAPAPDPPSIAYLIGQSPSALDLRMKGGILSSANPAVRLDFGGIGKGYAVDLACQILKEMGVQNAIVNAGGDLRAYGERNGRPWRIAVENPLGGVLGGLEIFQDESVFTSGNYARFLVTEDQQRFAHILDPRTGWPASSVLSVTVVAKEGWRADAAATAMVVAGLSEWSEVAAGLGLDEVLITDEQGQVYATAEMAARMQWSPGITPRLLAAGSD